MEPHSCRLLLLAVGAWREINVEDPIYKAAPAHTRVLALGFVSLMAIGHLFNDFLATALRVDQLPGLSSVDIPLNPVYAEVAELLEHGAASLHANHFLPQSSSPVDLPLGNDRTSSGATKYQSAGTALAQRLGHLASELRALNQGSAKSGGYRNPFAETLDSNPGLSHRSGGGGTDTGLYF
jgi:hypothetical protein